MPDAPRIDDPSFKKAVELIDAGGVAGLTAYLEVNPNLLSAQAEESGEFAAAYFSHPYLLWFVAENPIRNERLPSNVIEIINVIADTVQRHGIEKFEDQFSYTMGLAASGCVVAESGLQEPAIGTLVKHRGRPEVGDASSPSSSRASSRWGSD